MSRLNPKQFNYHARQMAKTPAPRPLSEQQFSGDDLAERARGIKHKAMRRAMPQPGNVTPYLPFPESSA